MIGAAHRQLAARDHTLGTVCLAADVAHAHTVADAGDRSNGRAFVTGEFDLC